MMEKRPGHNGLGRFNVLKRYARRLQNRFHRHVRQKRAFDAPQPFGTDTLYSASAMTPFFKMMLA